ncbi:MAG: hypothetical protein INR62_03130 [Rhodospirillales bacterium]|nr:hypothetical protein [Acetobacter sp.]
MQYALQVFETEDHWDFRVVDRNGEPWFVLADVCRALDLKPDKGSFAAHAAKLDPDDKCVIPRDTVSRATTPVSDTRVVRQGGNYTLVNESGLWNLIFRSDKPEAKRLKRWVTAEVLPTIRKTGSYRPKPQIPAFMLRQAENWDRVDAGYFSVINELMTRLYTRLALAGHVMADKAPDGTENRPDISAGRLFSTWLTKNHPSVCTSFTYYMHKTPQWEGEVRQYPMALLPLYIEFIDTVWIPEHFETYFKMRDAAALPFLQRLLPSPDRPRTGMVRGKPTASGFKRSA